MNLLVIGRGRVGSALAKALESSGQNQVTLAGRRVPPSRVREADVVILAVPDAAIEQVAGAIASDVQTGTCVLHCAGARGIDVLEPCRLRGAHVGVIHPLVSFPSKRGFPSLAEKTFALRGQPKAVAAGRRIARACGARAVVLQSTDGAYHAAAALAANGAAALAFASIGVLERLGFERRDAERAIGGLLQSVGENVVRIGVPKALTGPIARGEADTVAAHRAALRSKSKHALAAYDALVPIIVRCASAAGLSRDRAQAILRTRER